MGIVAELKHGAEEMWESVAEGWRGLSHQAAGALTHFKPRGQSSKAIGDERDLPPSRWALLASDMFEDDNKIVVRLEAPGMKKSDFDIGAHDDILIVRGEKHFESESSEGRYHMLQCAYGSFNRTIRLPAPVIIDEAKASYENGVLKIALPKAKSTKAGGIQIKVT